MTFTTISFLKVSSIRSRELASYCIYASSGIAPVDYAMNSGVLRPSIVVGILYPDGHETKFSNFIARLHKKFQAKHHTDFLISFPGFYEAFKTGLDLPAHASDK